MPTGTVKWFEDERGYGFVWPDDGGRNVFVHHSDIIGKGHRTLKYGDRVSYEVRDQKGRLQAVNVVVLSDK